MTNLKAGDIVNILDYSWTTAIVEGKLGHVSCYGFPYTWPDKAEVLAICGLVLPSTKLIESKHYTPSAASCRHTNNTIIRRLADDMIIFIPDSYLELAK
jgi:hypothetical protein